MRARSFTTAVLGVLCALLAVASPAGAATIDFDALADGAVLSDQFAAQGVLFGPTAAGTDSNPGEVDVVGSSRVDLQACKLEYSIVSPK